PTSREGSGSPDDRPVTRDSGGATQRAGPAPLRDGAGVAAGRTRARRLDVRLLGGPRGGRGVRDRRSDLAAGAAGGARRRRLPPGPRPVRAADAVPLLDRAPP